VNGRYGAPPWSKARGKSSVNGEGQLGTKDEDQLGWSISGVRDTRRGKQLPKEYTFKVSKKMLKTGGGPK